MVALVYIPTNNITNVFSFFFFRGWGRKSLNTLLQCRTFHQQGQPVCRGASREYPALSSRAGQSRVWWSRKLTDFGGPSSGQSRQTRSYFCKSSGTHKLSATRNHATTSQGLEQDTHGEVPGSGSGSGSSLRLRATPPPFRACRDGHGGRRPLASRLCSCGEGGRRGLLRAAGETPVASFETQTPALGRPV